MTSETTIALAGIAGTVLGAVLGVVGALVAPLIAERMRRKSARAERLLTERIAVYAELLTSASAMADEAHIAATTRHTPPPEPLVERLRAVSARALLLAGEDVAAPTHAIVKLSDVAAREMTKMREIEARRDAAGETGDRSASTLRRERLSKIVTQLVSARS